MWQSSSLLSKSVVLHRGVSSPGSYCTCKYGTSKLRGLIPTPTLFFFPLFLLPLCPLCEAALSLPDFPLKFICGDGFCEPRVQNHSALCCAIWLKWLLNGFVCQGVGKHFRH